MNIFARGDQQEALAQGDEDDDDIEGDDDDDCDEASSNGLTICLRRSRLKVSADVPLPFFLNMMLLYSVTQVARHVVQEKNDIKLAMEFLKECPSVKIEDILPFFPDFVTIDHFKVLFVQYHHHRRYYPHRQYHHERRQYHHQHPKDRGYDALLPRLCHHRPHQCINFYHNSHQ